MRFSLLNFSDSFTPTDTLVSLVSQALTRHIGLGGEEEGKDLFKGLQLYSLSLPLSVSALPLSAYTCMHVCVTERFLFALSKQFSCLPIGDEP